LKNHQQRKQKWMTQSDRCTIFFIKIFWTHEQDNVFTHASKLGIFFYKYCTVCTRIGNCHVQFFLLFCTACRGEKWQSYWFSGEWKLLLFFSWHLVICSHVRDMMVTFE
jgi:hypothetical protein